MTTPPTLLEEGALLESVSSHRANDIVDQPERSTRNDIGLGIIDIRKDCSDDADGVAPLSTSAQGVSTTSPSIPCRTASTGGRSTMGSSRRRSSPSNASVADGVYGPSTFGASERFKASTEPPQPFLDPKPLPVGRQNSFPRAPQRECSPAPAQPGPGSYGPVKDTATSSFRRTPSLSFGPAPHQQPEWIMLKSGMHVALLSSSSSRHLSPRRAEDSEGRPQPKEKESTSGEGGDAQHVATTPRKSSPTTAIRGPVFSRANRFPKSETDAPGPGAYDVSISKAISQGDEKRSRSTPRRKRGSWGPGPARSQSPVVVPRSCTPGPGAYDVPTSSLGRTGGSFCHAVRASNNPLPVVAHNTETRPLMDRGGAATETSWIHKSTNSFFRKSQDQWEARQQRPSTSRHSSRATTPLRRVSQRSSLPPSPILRDQMHSQPLPIVPSEDVSTAV
jgi:hypothetical protein